jgi:adenylate cyclase
VTVDDLDRAPDATAGAVDDVVGPAEAAAQAGVDEAFVRRLLSLGLLEAGPGGGLSEGDIRRTSIFLSLERAGLPLDAIGEANRRGGIDLAFVDDPAYGLFAGLTDATFRSKSEETGIPIELLYAVREAMGSAQPGPDDRMREMELQVVPAIELQLRHDVRQKVIERTVRSFGDNLRRMAEIEADWWMSDVMQPIIESGGTLADIGPRTAEFSNAFSPLSDQMVLALFHGNQANAWMKNFFQGFEQALERAGLHRATDRVPAICFLDLSGYTRLTEERGDEHAADLAGRLARLVQRTSSQHGGKPIKWLGDGVMFHFGDPGPGVLAALEMVEGAKEASLPPAHVGLHAGPVLFQEGDYFGRTVNVASRIADYARQGEVLVSEEVVAASAVPGVRFEAIGPVELKGLTEAVSLHVARRA